MYDVLCACCVKHSTLQSCASCTKYLSIVSCFKFNCVYRLQFAKEHSCCKISLKYVLDGAEAPAFLEGLEVTLMPDWTFMYLDKPAIENLVAWQH